MITLLQLWVNFPMTVWNELGDWMGKKCEVQLIKKEDSVLLSENEQYEGPIAITPIVTRVLDQSAVRAIIVPPDAEDMDSVKDILTKGGWSFEKMGKEILILRPKMKKSERKEIADFIQKGKSKRGKKEVTKKIESVESGTKKKGGKKKKTKKTKRGGKMKEIKRIIEELGKVEGVEFAAVLDDMGEDLASVGNPSDVTTDELLTQTSLIHGTSTRSGEKLKKGAVDEIDVMWEQGISILKTLDETYTLHVVTSKEALAWVRRAMKVSAHEIQEVLRG